ncbi:DUF1983 domain-containing protein [Klebsiella spallanzanii]|uniref:TipJ family phage tail tip protein n=1 Tax=Klebsiella spallanzanii TaxID=2587528 RepID=UPI001F461B3C|nr:DUF1983 domain-containing protein [Klebsiella spallanzanii]
MTQHLIKGRKGGSSSPRTPTEQPDDLQSVAKAKILLALGEGEFAGALTAKDIYLDGTPLENSDGSQNFSGVAWEFRPGTQAQNYIQGIPGSENEINVGTEISSKTAWTHSFSNTQLSAVRLRLKWPSLFKQEDNGDLMGNSVSYAVDLQTDGGSWQTVLESAVTGKTSSGYERCHRIDLPRANTGWVLRLRKVTEDVSTSKIGDAMTLQSYAEILDAKLRYPNTALLYVEFDSRQFNGSIPKIACSPRGRVIRVPDNYDPETRQYSGIWTGVFKWAWTDNPAWIFYDLIVTDRFGLGNRLTSENIDKWTLYQVARYCDEPVPDGKGGDGTEPRYLCNVYIQDRNDAYTVLRDFAAIFRGMTCWSGDQVIALADMPRDIDYTYTRANVINGRFQYASSSSKTRYTNALVSWSDPENEYADAMEPVFEQPLVARYGFNQLELTAIGCTRQSEANRKGRWGILTNNKDRVVTFSVGLDGNIPQPGYVIAVADEMLAGKVNGGRTSRVDGCVITLDRQTEAKAGDRLLLNLPSGVAQSRTIESVDGHVVTVTTEYTEVPETECVWAVESDSLKVQQYRVVSVKDNNDSTFTISAAAHDPDKYARIDTGAIIDSRPVSVIPPVNQSAPANIVVESYSVVNQGISVETLQVHWTTVKNAIAYEAQWRRNEGNWVNVPRSSVTSFDVGGIYSGRYTVRVRAINAAEVSSGWAYSAEKTLSGKTGLPSAPLALTTTPLLHGVQLNWAFQEGSGDTQKTELQYSPNQTGNGAMTLADVAFPGKSYQQMGLQIAAAFWYRARIVDRLGNESPWTSWVQGQASDDISEYYDQLTDAIKDTSAWQEVQSDVEETHNALTGTADAIRQEVAQQVADINQSIDETVAEIGKQVDGQIDSVNKSITENIDLVNQKLSDNITEVNKSITDAVSDINAFVDQQITDVNKTLTEGDTALKSQLQTVENSLKQSIAQANTGWDKAVKQETADRIADVNAKAAQAADQLLNEKNERVAAIDTLQTIIQDGDESLARQISEISAGSGQQFDSHSIWYFSDSNEGWTEDDSSQIPMQITGDGWLKASNSNSSCRSPNGQKIPASSYRTIILRIKRVGNPVWKGRLYWIGVDEQGWSDTRSVNITEQEFDGDGISVVAIADVNWNASGAVRRFRLDLAQGQNADNYFLIHWISVGRPAPAASTAALRNEEMARTQADEAEVLKRSTLAAQIRGTTDSNSLSDLRSGLLYQEMNARITADRAEVVARESLQTQFNDNKSSVAEELSSLSTAQGAQASKISGLETTLGKKADASALQSLTQKVEQQGTTITSQGSSLTSLTNRVGKAESGVAANSSAITGLQSSVSQQDKTLTSQSQAITKLQNDLTTTNTNVNKKADASAVTALTNRVTATEGSLTTQSGQLTMLKNSLADGSLISNGGMDVDLSFWENSGTGSAFTYDSGEKALRTTTGSIRVANVTRIPVEADTILTVSFEYRTSETVNSISSDTVGVITDLGNPIGWLSSVSPWLSGVTTSWQTKSVELTIPASFTGNYVYLRFAVGGWAPATSARLYIRKVDVFSSTGVSKKANASAVTDLTSRVDTAEGKLTSQSSAITKLQNDLTTTNTNVSKKAEQSAVQSLQNTVTQHGKDITATNSAITKLTSDLSTTNTNVNKKADATTLQSLQNTVTEQGKTLTSQSGSLTQLNNSLSDTTASLAADGKILGNLISNGSFERGQDAFTGWGSAGSVINAQSPNYGSKIAMCGVGLAGISQKVPVVKGNTYKIGVFARAQGGSVMLDQGNNKLRIGQTSLLYDRPFNTVNLSTGSSWTELTGTWKATIDGVVDVAIYSSLKSGAQYFDDFYFVDVTDKVNIAANAGAISSLNTTVTQHEKTITSQSNSLTSLNNSIGTLQAQVGNPWFDGSLESYAAGAQVGNSSLAAVSTAYAFSGSKSLCARRPSGDSGNSDKLLGTRSSVRESGIFRIELWAMMPANQAPSSGWSTIVGINAQNSAGSNSWNGAVTINEVSLGGRGKWVKFSGTCSIPAKMTRGLVWISCRGATGSGTPGYELYIDDVVITDITDANAAQNTANANASALTALTSRVTSAEGTLTSQSNAVTKLQNDLATTNSNVSKKADAAALNSLTSRVTNAEGKLDSQSSSITQLEASLDSTRDIGENLVENYDFRNQLNAWNQQNPSRIVWGATSGDGSAGVVITHTGDANNPGLMANNAKWFPVSSSRRFRFKVRAKLISGSGGILCRIFNSKTANTYTQTQAYVTKTGAFETLTVNLSVLPESATDARIAFYAYPSATVVAIDSIAVYDVTDEIASSTNASAISALTTRVTSAEGTITSQSTALTKLQNDLSTTNTNVNKKADQSALTSLTGRVANTESGLTAANSNITGLTSAIRAVGAAGDDYIPNPTFDPAYDQMGRVVVDTSSSGVPVGCPFKYAAKLASRDHIPGINNIAATAGDVIEFSALVACGAGTAAFNLYVGSAESPTGGIAAANAGGAVSAATGKTWVRTTWRWTVTATVAAKGYFRPFLQIAQTSPYGTIWYVTDWHCRNITAAAKAQSTADATASAVDSLTTKVTQQGDTLSSIGTRTTALENGLKTTNTNVSNKADASAVQTLQNMVTQQGKDITSANSAITKLTSDLTTTNANVNRKADATALQSLQNTVTEQGKTLTSQGSSLTQLNNALSDTTASLAADGKIPGNLISNGSFERGQDAFTGWSSIASVISAQSPNYGGKILMCSTGLAGISQQVPVVKGNTYKIGVFARAQGGSVMNDQGNNKLRIGQASLLYDRQFNTANLPTNASWIELTGTWKATVDGIVSVSVNSSLKSGAQYFDDFYFVDITGEVDIAANAGAISGLTTRVTSAEGMLTSQSNSITKLTNDLATTNGNVNKKADATALTALTNRVTSAEGKLDSQSSSITSLQNGLTTANTNISKKADSSTVTSLTNRVTQAENKLESQGSSVTSLNSSIVAIQQDADAAKAMPTNMLANNSFERGFDGWSNSGWSTLAAQNPKSGKYIIQATTSSNPTICDQAVNLTGGRTYRIGAWVRKSGDLAIRDANNTKISIRNSSGPLKDIPLTASIGTAWTLISADYKPSANAAITISLRTALSAGYLYADDAFCIDVSDEVANTANSSALTALNTQVKVDGENIKANAEEIKNLKVDVGKKATASALNELKTDVKEIDGKIDASVRDLSILDTSVGELKSTVKVEGETTASHDKQLKAMYSIKVETNNKQRVGAGMVLGSDGSTSDIIFYSDRFSLFNSNSKTAVPVMIAEGNELYIDSARIKNGSIDSAKISGSIQSTGFGAGGGWKLSKNDNNLVFTDENNVVRFKVGRL